MAKRKSKKKKRQFVAQSSAIVGEKLRAALRSIIRDWRLLREPLAVDEITSPIPKGAQRFRVRGAGSYEELQESILQFAGRVWQLKDGLIKWLQTRPSIQMVVSDAKTGLTVAGSGGEKAEEMIEEAAKLSLPLMLCADLYNTHKHYDDCNRSGYQPILTGVRLDTMNSGALGLRYDGARRTGDVTVANSIPVPFRVELYSQNRPVDFGDAVTVIGQAFNFWIPLIRGIELLSSGSLVDKAILDDLAAIEAAVKSSSPFSPKETVVNLDNLPIDQGLLARTDPAAFVAMHPGAAGSVIPEDGFVIR